MKLIRGTLQSPLPVRSGFRPRSGTWPIIPEPWPNCLSVKVLKTVVGGSVVYVAEEQQKLRHRQWEYDMNRGTPPRRRQAVAILVIIAPVWR
jgi:hypothetical protein